MKKITQVLNSPKRIGLFAICTVLIIGALALATIKVGANVNANKAIGLEKGVNVALQDAGFSTEQVTNLTAHYDDDDGIVAYDVEFVVNGMEYKYTIKASNGEILEANKESIKTLNNAPLSSKDTVTQNEAASNDKSATIVDDQTQVKPNSTSENGPSSKYIGADKAKEIALKHAGVSSSVAQFTKTKLDIEDEYVVYEIEFYANHNEYDYEIDATTGDIRNYSVEAADDDFFEDLDD